MTYKDALKYINDNSQNKILPGLSNMEKLCALLGNPQKKVKTIHIAGTNGKGSVGTFIETGLMHSGYKVCRYTSPAVLDYREKMTYNSCPISCDEFAVIVNEVKNKIENSGVKPTVFELETAIAFYYFAKKDCDFAVLETGMGGRLDATNVTDKILAVITSIDIDHTKFLGNTIEEIAEEKAGIIKDNAVSSPQRESVCNVLKSHSNNIVFAKKADNIRYSLENTTFDYKNYTDIKISMLGHYQVENATTAIEALLALNKMGYKIKDIPHSIEKAIWHCRFELISKKPLVIIDGAHNVQGARALEENIKLYLKGRETAFITGVLKDKDYEKMAEILAVYAKEIFTINSDSPRALSCEKFADTIRKYNTAVSAEKDIRTAVKKALKYENVLVFGSLSFMGSITEIFKEELCTTK